MNAPEINNVSNTSDNVKRRPRRSPIMRKFASINWESIATNTIRYGAVPATLVYIVYFTENIPTLAFPCFSLYFLLVSL